MLGRQFGAVLTDVILDLLAVKGRELRKQGGAESDIHQPGHIGHRKKLQWVFVVKAKSRPAKFGVTRLAAPVSVVGFEIRLHALVCGHQRKKAKYELRPIFGIDEGQVFFNR